MKKILVVFGTRPEAIKMAPVVLELKKHPENFETKVCVTAQHREMLDQVLKIFDIKPDYDLNLMKKNQDLFDISSNVLLGMKEILLQEKPDLVLVHGDTTTSSFTAMAAFYLRIPVGHVEAGLRTNNIYSPWPEEINRQITGRLASIHFAPTESAKNNLLAENISEKNIVVTGNTVIDALKLIEEKIDTDINLNKILVERIREIGYDRFLESERKYILVTGHRRENFGEGFENICNALAKIAAMYPHIDIVYPVHLNPNVKNVVDRMLSNIGNIYLIPPVEYLPFVLLMMNSYLILTDSGGIQEEAPTFKKTVFVMRDTTERPEAIAAGTAKLIGTSINSIVKNIKIFIDKQNDYKELNNNPFGIGDASTKIVEYLKKYVLQSN